MTFGRIHRAEPGPTRLPVLGKLKVGEKATKVKDGKTIEYPTSLDYFRADGKYAAKFHETYGEKPTKVEIVFYSPSLADVCTETYQVRDKAGRLLAEGDGETWRCWSPSRAEYVLGPSTLEKVEKMYAEATGKEHSAAVTLTLRFILPRIPSVFGIWTFTTKGAHSSIPAIRDTFDHVIEMAGALITNIPFDLIVSKVKGNRPGDTRLFPVVELIPNVSQENLDLVANMKLEGQKIRGLLTEARIKELAATLEVEPEVEEQKALGPVSPEKEKEETAPLTLTPPPTE